MPEIILNNVNIGDICALLCKNERKQLKDLENLNPIGGNFTR
jgi:hypothetical protein